MHGDRLFHWLDCRTRILLLGELAMVYVVLGIALLVLAIVIGIGVAVVLSIDLGED